GSFWRRIGRKMQYTGQIEGRESVKVQPHGNHFKKKTYKIRITKFLLFIEINIIAMNQSEFDIKEHKHKFAVWAAGRAASVKDHRFSVETARVLIDSINLHKYIDQPSALPEHFDSAHEEWCDALIKVSRPTLSYGVAAKLINIYLKCIFVCGGHHEHDKVKRIHPPIDRLLLKALATDRIGNRQGIWKRYAEKGWSNFDKKDYQEVIANIKDIFEPGGLYKVEHFWTGHQ
ncbi:MAG TPA: hypothetical protein PLC89_22260, partial [Haliscomenobacter sp.]|uniref:hypothetical protein n=1 Tax=Haliscomenobacter sp. TaxID=2717303 RepID=UPI002B54077A